MGFQILNSEDQPITIDILDVEACNLWGKEIHIKNYAYPEIEPDKFETYKDEFDFYRNITNWFDKIGYCIHEGYESWDQIYDYILEPFLKFPIQEILNYRPIGGYLILIRYWEAKGYKPKTIVD